MRTTKKEKWKDIPGFPGYRISNMGRVSGKRSPILVNKFNGAGYLFVALYHDKKHHYKQIHSLVIGVFGPPKPTKRHQVNHKDGKKANNIISNLEWMTRKQNMKHAVDTGLLKIPSGKDNHWTGKSQSKEHIKKRADAMRGSKNHQSKLSARQVIKIKELLKNGLCQIDIAKKFKVSQTTVSEIKLGKIWNHL